MSEDGFAFDGEDCPRDCGGQLEHQDAVNVMCLTCKEVFTCLAGDGEVELHDEEYERHTTKEIPDPSTPPGIDVRQNAGRCDSCGKPIVMDDGDELVIATAEEFENGDHDYSPEEVADSLADALEATGRAVDGVLADAIRENTGYRLHGECYEETSLSGWHEDAADEPDPEEGLVDE